MQANVRPSRHSGPMRVERRNQDEWKRPTAGQLNETRAPLCPACGAQGLELRKSADITYLCISCNHTWGSPDVGRGAP